MITGIDTGMGMNPMDDIFQEPGLDLDAKAPPQIGLVARPFPSFILPEASDPSILIGNRWLSRGDIAILASTSGMGKSSLALQAATHWALQLPLFGGFKTVRPLRSLIFQAEDGEGDVAEVFLSLQQAMKLTGEQVEAMRANVLIVTDRIHRGMSFRAELKRQIELHKPDLVWINPLLAFIGGDVNDSTDVGVFLREQLNSLNEPARFAYIIVHHTAKPPKEKRERQWNEVMYEMAGSADLTNAARAVLCLQATNVEGEFRLIAAKRGQRAGLTHLVPGTINANLQFEQPTSTVTLRHSKERMEVGGQDLGVIHWERCEDAPPESAGNKGGRPPKYTMADFLKHTPVGLAAALPAVQIWKKARTESGISEGGFKDLISRAARDGQVMRAEKPGVGPVFYL